MDRYTGFVDCPCCFESCGYLGDHSRGYDGADCFTPSDRPCPECNGTGKVECEPRTLDDLDEMDADAAAWVASICALVRGEHAAGFVGSVPVMAKVA